MSLWLQILLWCLGGGIAVAILAAAVRSGHPLRSLLGAGVQGLCALGLVNLLGAFTKVSLGVGWLSAGTGVLMGVPGVVCLLLLKVIFPPI